MTKEDYNKLIELLTILHAQSVVNYNMYITSIAKRNHENEDEYTQRSNRLKDMAAIKQHIIGSEINNIIEYASIYNHN